MYDIDIYYKKSEHNNMIYSIDMLRLKTDMTYNDFRELEFLINTFYKDNIKKFWTSDRVQCFHYNYVLSFNDNSFWFGFLHNSEELCASRDDITYNFTIEFNPNKLRNNFLIDKILTKFGNWHLKSYDLAIDIPINILDIVYDIQSKRKVHTFSYGKDNITYEIGSGQGRVKIYNKKIESDLNIVGHLTRVEVSVDCEDFPISNIKRYDFDIGLFPLLYLNQYLFSFSDLTTGDKTALAILYAVQHGYPIKDLSRRYKEKISQLLTGGSAIKFDKKTSTTCLQQTIYSYFVKRESRQVIF